MDALAIDRLIQNGGTFLMLGNCADAQESFTRASKEYPEDYRGWWGLIRCVMAAGGDHASLGAWFGYIRKLAAADVLADLEREYTAYLKKLADADAENDIAAANRAIRQAKDDAASLHSERERLKTDIVELKEELEQQIADFDARISRAAKYYQKASKGLKRGKGIVTAGVYTMTLLCPVAGLATCVATAANDPNSAVGVIMFVGASGFWIWLIGAICIKRLAFESLLNDVSCRPSYKVIENLIAEARAEREDAESGKLEEERKYREYLAELDNEIKNIGDRIARAEQKIIDCEEYIKYDKGTLSEMFFIQRCESAGITNLRREEDGAAVDLRKRCFE
jgi:predicted  nucleic acid-binding Zn-ribbon protein